MPSRSGWLPTCGFSSTVKGVLEDSVSTLPAALYSIAAPIAENERFLTVVATDGGDSLFWDWVFFGDPRLEMVSVDGRHETSVKAK